MTGCPCGDPRHDGLVDARELYAAKAARDHLAAILPHLDEPGAEVSVGMAFGEHGDHFRRAIRESPLHADAQSMAHVDRIRQWAEPDRSRALDRLGPDVVARAAVTRRRLGVVGAGIALSQGRPADDVVALSAAAETRPGPGRVMMPMLSHPRIRDRLRLAGHPDIRAQAGYGGRLYRGQQLAQPEPDEPAEPPATPSAKGRKSEPAESLARPRSRKRR